MKCCHDNFSDPTQLSPQCH